MIVRSDKVGPAPGQAMLRSVERSAGPWPAAGSQDIMLVTRLEKAVGRHAVDWGVLVRRIPLGAKTRLTGGSASLQIPHVRLMLSPLAVRLQADVIPLARELDIGIVPWGPMGTGLLTGGISSRADLQRWRPAGDLAAESERAELCQGADLTLFLTINS